MNEWDSFNGFGQQSPFGGFFQDMPLFFKIFAFIIIGFIAYAIIKSLKIWMSNNESPLITIRCVAVTKRTSVRGGAGNSSASTSYYVTFQFDDGERLELQVRDRDYGLIVEGDCGELTYQGTRFKDFDRN